MYKMCKTPLSLPLLGHTVTITASCILYHPWPVLPSCLPRTMTDEVTNFAAEL